MIKENEITLCRCEDVPEARPYGSKRAAFTLAEVLITLGIIGVVAAMTIPTLMHSIQEKQFTVAARKALSDVNNAYKMMQATDTEFNEIVCQPNLNYCASTTYTDNFKLLAKYFKASKTCFNNGADACIECKKGELGTTSAHLGCFGNATIAFIDNSGRAWILPYYNEGNLMVDTNGFAKPNAIGKDRWRFTLPNPLRANTQRGMIMPTYDYNITTKTYYCPSGDCKYGTVFYYKK